MDKTKVLCRTGSDIDLQTEYHNPQLVNQYSLITIDARMIGGITNNSLVKSCSHY